jgi:hypothetical protein
MLKRIITGLFTIAMLGGNASAQMAADEVFDVLKSLEGEWDFEGEQQGSCTRGDDADYPIVYKMIGKGTAVQEDLMPGSDYQMVTMYHVEDLNTKDIIGTHYCVKKNQPAYRADLKKSTRKQIFFECDETRTKLCKARQPYPGSYVDSIVYELGDDGDTLTVHYLNRGQKMNTPGYTRCSFSR